MPVTMRDVAERAGVSIATVSFVVNNTKPVKAKTRERIESAMAELGFQRNLVARALASRRTRILALVYPAQEHPLDRTGLEFVLSAARAAKEAEHHLVVWPIANQAAEMAALAGQGLVDGVVLMEVQLEDPRVAVLQQAGLPFALIGRTRELAGLAYVDIDFDATIASAVDHLADLGHRRVVLITGDQEDATLPHYAPFVRQVQAFRRLAAERGLEPIVHSCDQNAVAARDAAFALAELAPDATAIILTGEQAALGLMAGLRRRGLRIPDDVSVVCTVASEVTAVISDPPLTIVTSPGPELGRLAVEAVLSQLRGEGVPEPQLRSGILRIGESTGPAPAS